MSIDSVISMINYVNIVISKLPHKSKLRGDKLLDVAKRAFESLPIDERGEFIESLKLKVSGIIEASLNYHEGNSSKVFKNIVIGKINDLQKNWLRKIAKDEPEVKKISPGAAKRKRNIANAIPIPENKIPESQAPKIVVNGQAVRGVYESLTQIRRNYQKLCTKVSTIEDPGYRSALAVINDVQEALLHNPEDAPLEKLNKACQSISEELDPNTSMIDVMSFSFITDKIEQLKGIVE